MTWVCPVDHQTLAESNGRLTCTKCGHSVVLREGIPVFIPNANTDWSWRQPVPDLEVLWSLMDGRTWDDAAESFCKDRDVFRMRHRAGWRFVFPAPEDGHLLELGSGCGDDAAVFQDTVSKITCVTPHVLGARILKKRFEAGNEASVNVMVTNDLTKLPLARQSVDGIVLDNLSESGFPIKRGQFAEMASEWRRILAPGGVVLLGLRNRVDAGLNSLRAVLQSGSAERPMNQAIKAAGEPYPAPMLSLKKVCDVMELKGFDKPEIYAPLPHEKKPQVMVPIDDTRIVRYFLNHLIRKNSAMMQTAVASANTANRIGMFRSLVPFHYLVFHYNPNE